MKGALNIWLLVIVAICAASFWFGKDLLGEPGADPGPDLVRPDTSTVGPTDFGVEKGATVEQPHLVVLNGTAQAGLAGQFALLLSRAGCVADQVGNAPHDRYGASFLVNRRLSPQQAARLAAVLGGVPVLQEFDGRTTADAVLVLGNDAERIRVHLEGS